MTEDHITTGDEQQPHSWAQHRFITLVGIAIVIAVFLVGVSLALYASSGTAQLDLSRPGYVSVRDQASKTDETFDGFSSSGAIDKTTLEQFRRLYAEQSKKATSVDSFGGAVMSDQALSIDAPVVSDE
jgi:hypothetical protein